MPVDPPFNVYRDQLTSLYHGLALWNPSPPKTIYNHVSIGDVGYVRAGVFIRMFNVVLPWDHESNRTLGEPEPYESLDCSLFTNVLEVPLKTQELYSRYVSAETNDSNAQAKVPDNAEGVTYTCRGHGALLLLPRGGRRVDIIRTKVFEDYIRDNVVNWFRWAQKNQQGIERMEDLLLVSGCTLVSSWAAAAFVYNTMEAKISLARRTFSNGGESFVWGNIRGSVEYHDSDTNLPNPPTTPDQCVFIRGFRAKRILFWTKPIRAAAEPSHDDPDNHRDDEIQVTGVPDGPNYRDPLIGILDYIAEKCSKESKAEDIIAIAHDDDLRLVQDVEILTADAIEEVLREKQIPLLVENDAAVLRDSPRTRQSTVERHDSEGQSQQEIRPPSSHRVASAASMSALGDRQSPTTQFGSSLSALKTGQMMTETEAQYQQQQKGSQHGTAYDPGYRDSSSVVQYSPVPSHPIGDTEMDARRRPTGFVEIPSVLAQARMPLAEALAMRPTLPPLLATPASTANVDRVEDRSDSSSTGSGRYVSSFRSSHNTYRTATTEPVASGPAPSLPSLKASGLLDSWPQSQTPSHAMRPTPPPLPPTPASTANVDRVEDRSDSSSTGSGTYFSSLTRAYNKYRTATTGPVASGSAPSLPSLKSSGLLESWQPQTPSHLTPEAGMSERPTTPTPTWVALRKANVPNEPVAGPDETTASPSTSRRDPKSTMPVGLEWLANEHSQ